jgi:hypothetical protein
MYVCMLVEDLENLCFWMGSFIYFSIIIVKTQVEKPNLDEATICGII